MSPDSPRRMPASTLLALLGALGALGALALPFMASDTPVLPPLLGYEDGLGWVALRVVAAVGAALLALRLIPVKPEEVRETHRVVFFGAAAVFLLRPVMLIATNPRAGDFKGSDITLESLYAPSWGIFLSAAAALAMLAAAVLVHRSDDAATIAAREAARAKLLEDPELAAFASDAPAPIVPIQAVRPVEPAAPDPVSPATEEPAAAAQDAVVEPAPVAQDAVVEPAPVTQDAGHPPATIPPAPVFEPPLPAPPTAPAAPVRPVRPSRAVEPAPAYAEREEARRDSVAPPGFG